MTAFGEAMRWMVLAYLLKRVGFTGRMVLAQ